MTDDAPATTLDRLRVYPIKSLDGVDVDAADLGAGGGLASDREFALLDADGDYVNGKSERRIHRVRADFDLDARTVRLAAPHDEGPETPETATFSLDDGHTGIESWMTAFLGYEVSMVGERAGGYPDRTRLHGPSVVSTGTLREVASWYDGVSVDSMRRRLRANVELASGEAFFEDRLVAEPGERVRVRAGDVDLFGVDPCQRCAVPARDPDTGEEYPDFRTRFIERREATMPSWSGGGRFDDVFRVMVNTAAPEASVGGTLRVGDAVRVVGTDPE